MAPIFVQIVMALRTKLNFTTMSTALLLSIVALPITVVAFAEFYVDKDSFWSVVWMAAILPTLWVAATVLSIRDAIKGRSWRQIAGVVVLIATTVFLFSTMMSRRFAFHQLFTFRPLDLHLPTHGIAFLQKFSVCRDTSPCASSGSVTETKSFKLARVPDGCCYLRVINGRGDRNNVEALHVVFNGMEIKLRPGEASQMTTVKLANDNEVTVQISGAADAYIFVIVWYTGEKESPPA